MDDVSDSVLASIAYGIEVGEEYGPATYLPIIRELQRRRAAMTPRPMETVPRDRTRVLVWYPHGSRWLENWFSDGGGQSVTDPFTAWFPMPEAPTDG